MKILIVDDEPEVCKVIKLIIEPLGVEVRISTDSQEAAATMEGEKFDGVILDAVMPNLDGYDLARKIRATPLNQQVPIIMLTGMDDVKAMRQAFNAGVTFFIGKPFTREKIYAIFRTTRGAMLAERRRCVRLPYRTNVTCLLRGKKFNATSISIGEGGIGLQSSGTASVEDSLELEFSLPDVKEPIKVTGKIQVKEDSGRTSIEFIHAGEPVRNAIREFVSGKVKD